MTDPIPPTDLVLAALHAIKSSVDRNTTELQTLRVDLTKEIAKTNERLDQTNERLDQTNERLDQTNERLDNLRVQTMQKFTELTVKMDEGFAAQTRATNRNTAEVHELRDRFDHFLSGAGAQLVLRVDKVEVELARLAAKVDH